MKTSKKVGAILHHFKQPGLLGDCHLHEVDSTELANYCKILLTSIEIKGKKIRIYNDIDCDCGARRNKRDKSNYVIGYDPTPSRNRQVRQSCWVH